MANDEQTTALIRELVRKVERLERNQNVVARDILYIREAVKFRIAGSDVYEDSPALTHTFRLDVETDFYGLNWYFPEVDNGYQCRWSGPGLLSTIYLPLARDLDLICRVMVGAFAPQVPTELSFFVDGKSVPVQNQESGYFEFIIPAARKLRAQTELGVVTKQVTQPNAIVASSDARWLGFQLRALEVFPDRAPE